MLGIALCDGGSEKKLHLHRFIIYQLPDSRLICKLEISHLLCDGVSLSILLRDLGKAYDDQLSPEGQLYRDYIKFLLNQIPDSSLAYWREKCEGLRPCHFPHIAGQRKEFKSMRISFSEKPDLDLLCKKHGLTTASVLQTIWGLVLRRYTGLNQPCFGYAVAGRNAPIKDIQDAVGPYINVLICQFVAPREQILVELAQACAR